MVTVVYNYANTPVMTSCKLVSTNIWGSEKGRFVIMLKDLIATLTYSLFCLREISNFLVLLSGCICLSTCLYHRTNTTRATFCACRANFASTQIGSDRAEN
jgi:hypothetical protein